MRISDGSIGSQLDTAPSISFPLGFLKFIAHSTSLRSVAHRGLPFSDHCTSWVCTEMLIYHHVSSAGLCEPAWVRCTPWENLAFPARGRRCFTPLRVCVSLFGAPSALGPCAARAEFVTVLDRGWDEIQEGKLPRTLSAQRTGGFSTWTLTGQGDTCWGGCHHLQSSLSQRTVRIQPSTSVNGAGISTAPTSSLHQLLTSQWYRNTVAERTFLPLLYLLRDLSIKECICMQEPS